MIDHQTAIRPAIDTPRLVLRPHRPSDAPRIAALANDLEVVKMTGGMPFPYGLADAEGFIARAANANLATDVDFAVELPGEGLIGGLGFFTRAELAPEVGYWLGRPYWGRGYATEMLRAAMAWARAEWGQRCVLACHFLDNPASGTVLGRAGFLYTGRVEPRPCRARGCDVVSRWMAWLA
jgi:RimJ/RimL family protein N-acetyltransferase